jgi:hypothetical protein
VAQRLRLHQGTGSERALTIPEAVIKLVTKLVVSIVTAFVTTLETSFVTLQIRGQGELARHVALFGFGEGVSDKMAVFAVPEKIYR